MTQAECGELKITPRYAEMKQRNEYINKRLHVCISVFIYLSITMQSMSVRNDGIVTPLHFDGTNLADLGGGGCDGLGVMMVAVVEENIEVVGAVVVVQKQSWRCTQ